MADRNTTSQEQEAEALASRIVGALDLLHPDTAREAAIRRVTALVAEPIRAREAERERAEKATRGRDRAREAYIRQTSELEVEREAKEKAEAEVASLRAQLAEMRRNHPEAECYGPKGAYPKLQQRLKDADEGFGKIMHVVEHRMLFNAEDWNKRLIRCHELAEAHRNLRNVTVAAIRASDAEREAKEKAEERVALLEKARPHRQQLEKAEAEVASLRKDRDLWIANAEHWTSIAHDLEQRLKVAEELLREMCQGYLHTRQATGTRLERAWKHAEAHFAEEPKP